MDTKDDRYKSKRSNMKQHKKPHHRSKQPTMVTESSSSQAEGLRGIIDVADSSDDRFSMQSIPWSPRDIESEQMSAGDFGMLSQMPPSIGGHFQFSSEKNWDTDDTWINKTEASEYFTLDINLLNAGLQTIPFYKRLDFPSLWFTKTQLKAMNQAAEIAEKNYQSVLNDHQNNSRGVVNSASKRGSAQKARSSNGSGSAQEKKPENVDKDQELDELLSLTTSEVAKVNISDSKNSEGKTSRPPSSNTEAKAADSGENREEIQQWLDDVLEE